MNNHTKWVTNAGADISDLLLAIELTKDITHYVGKERTIDYCKLLYFSATEAEARITKTAQEVFGGSKFWQHAFQEINHPWHALLSEEDLYRIVPILVANFCQQIGIGQRFRPSIEQRDDILVQARTRTEIYSPDITPHIILEWNAKLLKQSEPNLTLKWIIEILAHEAWHIHQQASVASWREQIGQVDSQEYFSSLSVEDVPLPALYHLNNSVYINANTETTGSWQITMYAQQLVECEAFTLGRLVATYAENWQMA